MCLTTPGTGSVVEAKEKHMSTAQHRAAVRRRTPRKTIVGVTALVLALIAGTAYALYVLLAGVGGTVTSKSLTSAWMTTNVTATGPCTATATGGASGKVTVTVNGWEGDVCTVTAPLKNGSTTDEARVTGVALTGLPAGWSAALDSGSCGATLKTDGIAVPVTFKITVGPAGSSGTLGGGLTISPTSQVGSGSLTCPTQTGA